MRAARLRAGAFALGLLVGLPSLAAAQLDCQVPTRERVSTGSLNSPALAPIRKVALAVEAIVKKNAVFMAGVRPIRVRTTIDYALDAPRTAFPTAPFTSSSTIRARSAAAALATRSWKRTMSRCAPARWPAFRSTVGATS